MKFLIRTLPTFVSLALTACADAPLPSAMTGEWDRTPVACEDEDAVTRFWVRSDRLEFYEWGGRVVAVQRIADGAIRIDMDWSDVSDTDINEQPNIRRESAILRLSPDRSRLDLEMFGETVAYVRCP